MNNHIENHHPDKWQEILKSRKAKADEKERRRKELEKRKEVHEVGLKSKNS